MNRSTTLLVVDDDPELRDLTKAYLVKNGFVVNTVESSVGMDEFLETNDVDLLVLDLMLPGEHGLAIAKRLKKKKDLPIIIVSAQGEDIDRIVGLEIGADDYLPKPFNPRELLARIRAVLRRSNSKIEEKETESSRLIFNDYELDLNAHSLSKGGEKVTLTSGEFDLLALLAANPNRVLHRDTILDKLTGAERSPFDRSIDVRVTRLRGKLEFDPSKPELIKTIWGKGYMFCPSQDA